MTRCLVGGSTFETGRAVRSSPKRTDPVRSAVSFEIRVGTSERSTNTGVAKSSAHFRPKFCLLNTVRFLMAAVSAGCAQQSRLSIWFLLVSLNLLNLGSSLNYKLLSSWLSNDLAPFKSLNERFLNEKFLTD